VSTLAPLADLQQLKEYSEMNSLSEKVLNIQTILDNFYPTPAIPLNHDNPFQLLISVVLSAQTTDKMVNIVTPRLFELAPTPQHLAQLEIPVIAACIQGIGLSNNKAKFLKSIGEQLVAKFDSKVPQNYADLESLPGVGHKTASVVMSQAFGFPAFAVDTHIHRLAQRWSLSDGSNVVQTEKDLKKAFPEQDWNKLHLQMIYYGREYCPARGHKIENCQICLKYGQR
jgi:endonuclease III